MKMHQLRYFVAVVEEGSFSRAAERMHVAQPSLKSLAWSLPNDSAPPRYYRSTRCNRISSKGKKSRDRSIVDEGAL